LFQQLFGEAGLDYFIVYFGVGLLIATVILSGYALILKKIDIKRIIAFAAISFFSGTILLLSERITTIRLPVLGEIVTKAREDAMEIMQIRKEMESQRERVLEVVKQAETLQQEMEQLTIQLQIQKRNARKMYLHERIDELQQEIAEREHQEIQKYIGGDSLREVKRKFDVRIGIQRLNDLVKKYSEELNDLDKEEGGPGSSKMEEN
jgi:hypothetical protein